MTGTACDTNTVTPLRQRMEEQLRIANLAASTSKAYICEIKNLARYYDASPDELDAEQVRQWYLGRIDKGLSPGTTNVSFAALNCKRYRAPILPADLISGLTLRLDHEPHRRDRDDRFDFGIWRRCRCCFG